VGVPPARCIDARVECLKKSEASPAPWKSSGLALAPIEKGDIFIMMHRERLHPWIIVRLLPKMQRIVVGRFRNWLDADGHLRILKQLIPGAELIVVFDPGEMPKKMQSDKLSGTLRDRI
jgi:hypothetical protein